jgi:Uma2 family endonuclease
MIQAIRKDTQTITFAEYLVYEGKPGVLYELYRGKLIEMGTPTVLHTRIIEFLKAQLIRYFIRKKLPLVAITVMGVRTEENSSRIPDVVVCTQNLVNTLYERGGSAVLDLDQIPLLVIEVTSDNWRTDYKKKRAEYALVNIPEYWIVDPKKLRIRICNNLPNQESYPYRDFELGQMLRSVQFGDFELPVSEILFPSSEYDIVEEEFREREDLKVEVIEAREETNAERLRAQRSQEQAQAERLRSQMAEEQAQAERLRSQMAEEQAQRAEEQAQSERLRAQMAEEQAQSERLRAQRAEEQAQMAEEQAQSERLRAEKLADKLREMGLNLEDL